MEPEHDHGAAVALPAQRSIVVFPSRREQHMNSRAIAARRRTARSGCIRVDGPLAHLCDQVARLLVEKIR